MHKIQAKSRHLVLISIDSSHSQNIKAHVANTNVLIQIVLHDRELVFRAFGTY